MKKVFTFYLALAVLFTMSGCGFYGEYAMEEIRAEAWEAGYEEGKERGYENGREDSYYEMLDDYSTGYSIGWDEALKEYGISDSGSDTSIGTGFRDGWIDALYEYSITP